MSIPEISPDLIEKIQKLLNLQEGAASIGSHGESEAAASRIQALLMKHNLDLDTVKEAQIKKKAVSFTDEVYDLKGLFDKRESLWVPKLYTAVAINNLCKAWYDTAGQVHIIGRTEQVQLVLYISEQLIAKIRIAEKLSWNAYDGIEKRGTYRRGFFDGAAQGINNRLYKDRTAENNPYAVMVVSREQEVDDYIRWGTIDPDEIAKLKKERDEAMQKHSNEMAARLNAMTPKERKAWEKQQTKGMRRHRPTKGPRGLTSNDGYTDGKTTGERMNINKGMDGSKSKANLQ